MVFSSITFLVYFLPAILCLYYMAPVRMRNFILLTSSLFFYAWGEPIYVILMLISIFINYSFGILIDSTIKSPNTRFIKLWMALNLCANLGILGFFKYGDFVIKNINALFGTEMSLLNIPLPIGISFYTFQAMSYIIDLYRGKVRVQKNIVDFGTYIALFPQLIAGPIVRFKTIEEQLRHRVCNVFNFAAGSRRFILGLGKKVLIANNVGMVWDSISSMPSTEMSALSAWLGAVAFTLQIYFDFSGYSDMAIGLGKMFGFTFDENFRHPYSSKSITEFWRRWHISLGTWFKEYVYIPLGGNKYGAARQTMNILIVWALTGLWHGASWNFVIWGGYFAVILILEKLFINKLLERLDRSESESIITKFFGNIALRAYTLILVIISWVIFAIEDSYRIPEYLKSMVGFSADAQGMYLLQSNFILFVIAMIAATEVPQNIYRKLESEEGILGTKLRIVIEISGLIAILILSVAYSVASTYNPFLYFRF